VHYDDLSADLAGEMRRLAARLLTPDELAFYHARVASMAPAAMLSWLHRP